MNRREKLLYGLDLRKLTGIEIGPLACPMVSKGCCNMGESRKAVKKKSLITFKNYGFIPQKKVTG